MFPVLLRRYPAAVTLPETLALGSALNAADEAARDADECFLQIREELLREGGGIGEWFFPHVPGDAGAAGVEGGGGKFAQLAEAADAAGGETPAFHAIAAGLVAGGF